MLSLISKVGLKLRSQIVKRFSFESKLNKIYRNKSGIEIGGPSPIFSSGLPIYPIIKALDGCNFSNNTIWEGSIEKGWSYKFYKDKVGYQYISEASNLKEVPSNKYDFLLASHCLEHCANPLKTVREWLRVIKPRGYILMILPDKQYTFDHKRPITRFEHILEDFTNDVDEADLTHLDEILALHDLSRDLAAGEFEDFKQRSLRNVHNRCLHHHVFDFDLLECFFKYLKVKPRYRLSLDLNQIIVGQKR